MQSTLLTADTLGTKAEEVGQLSRDKFRPMSSVHRDVHVGRKIPWRNSEALGKFGIFRSGLLIIHHKCARLNILELFFIAMKAI